MLDPKALVEQIRTIVARARRPLSGADVLEQLPCRDALLADCANRAGADEAWEVALEIVRYLLLDAAQSVDRDGVAAG